MTGTEKRNPSNKALPFPKTHGRGELERKRK